MVVLCVAHVLVMCEGFAVAVHTEGRSFILRTSYTKPLITPANCVVQAIGNGS